MVMTAIVMLLVVGAAHRRSHRCYRCHRRRHRRCTRCRCCWLPGLCMRLVLRLPPSSVVVCMSENPNQGGLVRTVLGHRRGSTHSLEGADPGTGQGVEMPPCVGAPSSPLLFVAWHAEESQQGGTGQNNVREWKEGTHLLEGADPGTGQDVEGHSMAVNLGQRKRAQTWLLQKSNTTRDDT